MVVHSPGCSFSAFFLPMSTSPAESPALLARLRAETRPYHDAVEANPFNQALAVGTVTAADTARFLARMYGVVQPYEQQLRAHAALFGPAWQLDRRYRAHLILEDLPLLGYDGTPPLCPALPPLATWPQLLGAMYVLEGSTLGGQVIARQLIKSYISANKYFTGRADQTGPLWKGFCVQLTDAVPTSDHTAIISSAEQTFQTLATWLSQP